MQLYELKTSAKPKIENKWDSKIIFERGENVDHISRNKMQIRSIIKSSAEKKIEEDLLESYDGAHSPIFKNPKSRPSSIKTGNDLLYNESLQNNNENMSNISPVKLDQN